MNNLRVTVDTSQVMKNLGLVGAAADRASSLALRQRAGEIAIDAKGQVPVASSALKQSIRVGEPRKTLRGMEIDILAGDDKAPYAVYVHEGTSPHFPPVSALMNWVQIKLRITDPDEARGVAFAIAKKIERTGTPAFKFLERPFLSSAPKLQSALAAAIKDAVI